MVSEEAKGGCLVVILIAAVGGMICLSAFVSENSCNNRWQREAVARGVAEYDAKTGEWKWTVERKVAE